MRALVTGCGRSGTRFVAAALRKAGVNAGYESIFTVSQHEWPGEHISGVEVSWFAVPYLTGLPDDVSIVHLIRHPLDVVRSFLGFHFFNVDTENRQFVWRHCPGVDTSGEPIDQALQYWFTWNSMVHEFSHRTVRIEFLSPISMYYLFDTLGVDLDRKKLEKAFIELGTRHNGRERADTTSTQILKRPLGAKVRRLAGEYGYKL